MHYDLIIIGGGAAGLFAAAQVPVGTSVLLLEKTDKLGQKLLLSGGGQCNITHSRPISEFLTQYGAKGKRLRPILFSFSNLALMQYLEENGLPLLIREDGKVFPKSLNAQDLLDLLLTQAKKNGVQIKTNNPVLAFSKNTVDGFSVQTENGNFSADKLLITIGGASVPKTGSDGSFFEILERFGCKMVPLSPALCPIFVQNYPFSTLSGISFPNISITILRETRKILTAEDALLFTHHNLSGPVILNNAREIQTGDILSINFLPTFDLHTLTKHLSTQAIGEKRQVITFLENETMLPRRFLELICQTLSYDYTQKAASLSKSQFMQIAKLLTETCLQVSHPAPLAQAMVTKGGVCLDEVDLKTLASKRYPNLYFAGEVLDVDGNTGGYNLQFAFSSAKKAVTSMFFG